MAGRKGACNGSSKRNCGRGNQDSSPVSVTAAVLSGVSVVDVFQWLTGTVSRLVDCLPAGQMAQGVTHSGEAGMRTRQIAAALTLSASALVGIALHEGYRDTAYIPVAGDMPTIGLGTTEGMKMGDRITPAQGTSPGIDRRAEIRGGTEAMCSRVAASVRVRRLCLAGLQHWFGGVLWLNAGAEAECRRLRRSVCRD